MAQLHEPQQLLSCLVPHLSIFSLLFFLFLFSFIWQFRPIVGNELAFPLCIVSTIILMVVEFFAGGGILYYVSLRHLLQVVPLPFLVVCLCC